MASRFLIAVGGSGQHIALAITRLVYMGALKNDIQLIGIDPDNKEPLSRTLLAPANMAGARHPLKQGQVHAPFDVSKHKPTFAPMFVDEHNLDERELFEAMFHKDMDDIPVHKGMYGTPCVGATVFAEGAQNSSFSNILAPVQNATEVHVCGSVVGGTGAGITHKLIKEIRTRYVEPKPLFGVFMLPWFKVQSSGDSKSQITNALIQRNATHGIKYFFEHTIPSLTNSALIGFPENAQSQALNPLTVSSGEMGQERPHFLHLASSYALSKLRGVTTADRGGAYYVSHPLQEEDWLLSDVWEEGTPLVGMGGAHKDDPPTRPWNLRQRIRAHQVLLNLLAFLTHDAQREAFEDNYGKSRFRRTFASHSSWGDDLHASITNAEPDTSQQWVFVESMLNELEQIRQEVQFCVDWAQALFNPGLLRLPQGDPLLDRLLSSDSEKWKLLKTMWMGRETLKPDASRKLTAASVARSHAKFILDAALKG
jgi:hypothetical protein